jgi:pimeloyl-ACP methyl ester carboxylesterase
MDETLQMRVHGDGSLPALVYLPGMHGDWTLVSSFRAAVAGKVRFVEFAYPRTTTWSLGDYAGAIEQSLLARGVDCGWLLGESYGSQPAWELVRRFLDHPRRRLGTQVAKEPGSAGSGASVPAAPAGVPPASEPKLGARGPAGKADSFSAAAPILPAPSVHVSDIGGKGGAGFRPLGLVLAGGFVKHPVNWAVRLAARFSGAVPLGFVRAFCGVYSRYATFRHRRAPETLASITEFVANRVDESDRRAIVQRYRIIAENDLRPVARRFHLPVFYLAGLVDPLVPWCYVRWWLRANCPGYRGGKTVWRADHNVLGTAPEAAARLILAWMTRAGGG